MKFGLVVYLKTDNIGDDVQSYAAKRFLPTVDYVIDREALDTFDSHGEVVKAIMNGWYMYSKFNWPPASVIDPLWVAMHISENDYFGIGERFLEGIGGDYLRHYAPIGARDVSTLEMLERNHIPAYLSGCLTLTIPQFSNVEKTNEVLLVDLDEKSEAIVRKMYPAENFQSVTHNVNAEEYSALSAEDRLRRVEKLLRRYQGAKCVITSRLHCALPCLALQTPVLLVYKREYAPRIQSFLSLLHYSNIGNLGEKLQKFCVENPIENKKDYLSIRDSLTKLCRDFIADETIKTPYKVSLEELHLWQKGLLSSAEFSFRSELDRQTEWIRKLDEGKEYLSEQCRSKDRRIDELQQWNQQLESGKQYLEQQVAAKDARINELEQWDQQLEKGKAYLEQQVSKKDARIAELEKWCQEVTAGKEYVEAQWHAEEQRREADKQRIDELIQRLNSNSDQTANDTAQ
ncbi:MAG: polysaccharide pyruvyl transferase family protein [Oscillospiraceae bacterium]